MPVRRLGAVEENPVALVGGASLEPREPARLRETDHLRQHTAESARAGGGSELDLSLIGDRQHQRELPARGRELATSLLGLRPMLRWIPKKIPQGLPQFQRGAVVTSIDKLSPVQQTALAHPFLQQARRLDLVSSRMRNSAFHVAAFIEGVHEIVKQRELARHGVCL